jgi:phospholipase/lecithinase/hemolysin
MKKLLFFLMLFFLNIVNVQAAPIHRIVFFGDSLSDNGNIYNLLLHLLPKSPPYFEGRFSNGPTWAENVGKYYYDKNYADYKIYALGGATALFHLPTPQFISPTTLELEVDKYLIDSIFNDRSNVLFAIWIGGNDYIFDANANPDTTTSKVVAKIEGAINTLKRYGAKNFLIMNLPDLSKIPQVQGSGLEAQLHAITLLHNTKLAIAVQNMQINNPGIKIIFMDIYNLFNDMISNPEKYNQKYNVNLTNLTESCWKGNYWIKKPLSEQGLTHEIQQAFIAQNTAVSPDFDAQAMSNFIMSNSDLSHAYQMGKSIPFGNVPCVNPNEYLYWDSIHPTAVLHRILAQIVIEALGI